MLRRWTHSKAWIVILGVAAIGALVMLAAGLPNFVFEAPSGYSSRSPTRSLPATGSLGEMDPLLMQRILIAVTVIFTIMLLIALFDKKSRQRLLKFLAYALLFILLTTFTRPLGNTAAPTATPPPASSNLIDSSAAPPYVPPEIPLLAAFLTALVLVLAGIGAAYYFWLRRPLPAGASGASLSRLKRIAQSTLDDLNAGHDWEDAVIRCYERMIEAVGAQRGLHRRDGMTAAEFAADLERAGLPSGSVHRLTHLFESARYGAKRSTQADVDEAVGCLGAIVEACGGAG